jgi:hypothetical protein
MRRTLVGATMHCFLPVLLCTVLSLAPTCGASAATPGQGHATAGDDSIATIEFDEFFKLPVGDYGLEPSARLLELQGRVVRITGYVADEQEPMPGLVLLAPAPVTLSEREDGPADDLPGSTVFVHLPRTAQAARGGPGPVELIGRLDVGGKEEVDGRISYVRLYVDDVTIPSAAQASTATQHSAMETHQ